MQEVFLKARKPDPAMECSVLANINSLKMSIFLLQWVSRDYWKAFYGKRLVTLPFGPFMMHFIFFFILSVSSLVFKVISLKFYVSKHFCIPIYQIHYNIKAKQKRLVKSNFTLSLMNRNERISKFLFEICSGLKIIGIWIDETMFQKKKLLDSVFQYIDCMQIWPTSN